MSRKSEVIDKINQVENNLTAQLEAVAGMRGIHEDVIRMMVPAMQDQIALLREIAALIPEGD